MAKADDTSSTIVWISLRDALALAAAALGSEALAKALLTEWMAAGKLPWSWMLWKGLDAETLAGLQQISRRVKFPFLIAPIAYPEGDPQFLRAATIDWEDNAARVNAAGGAEVLGIKVSRKHLLPLLPEEPREREEVRGAGASAPPAQPVSEGSTEPRPPGAAPVRAHPLVWTMTHDIIRRLYPDGRVPESVQTATVEKQVAAAWREECKAHSVPYSEPPDWTTIARHLDRRKNKKAK